MSHIKVRFAFTNSYGETEVESLWAKKCDGGLEMDNVPFHVKEVALGDVIATEEDKDGLLWFSRLVKASGHSTVQLWLAEQEDVSAVREKLRQMGCISELSELPRLIAVDVPPEISYDEVKIYLEEGAARGIFDYQEACLGFL